MFSDAICWRQLVHCRAQQSLSASFTLHIQREPKLTLEYQYNRSVMMFKKGLKKQRGTYCCKRRNGRNAKKRSMRRMSGILSLLDPAKTLEDETIQHCAASLLSEQVVLDLYHALSIRFVSLVLLRDVASLPEMLPFEPS
jgi:hypothetical protein